MLLAVLPEDSGDNAYQHQYQEDLNEAARKPVFAFAFVQNDLHAAEAQADQPDSDVVDAESLGEPGALHVRRVAYQQRGQQQRENADRNVDVKNPAPGKIVGDPAAEPGADGRRDDHRNAIHGEGHAALFERKGVVQDGLLARLQSAAAHSLQNAEQDQHAEARSEPAEKAAHREKSDAGHVKALAAEQPGE